jgi:hypothetical protein
VKTLIPDTSSPGRPNIGQRIIKTTARLQDGETAVFGGLLKEEEAKTLEGVWGITDVPVLGSILGHTTSRKVRTDVILTLRAVVLRSPSLQGEDFDAFDPDRAPSATKPFAPKPDPPAAQLPAAPAPAEATPAAPPPAEAPPDVPGPAEARPESDGPDVDAPEADGPEAAAKPPAAGPGAAATPVSAATAPVVFYLAPLTAEAEPGERLTLRLAGSGTKGLTGGTMALQVDPRLKVLAIRAGDLANGASFQATPGGAGSYTLNFNTAGQADQGTLAVLDLQAVNAGEATVTLQAPSLNAGANPLSGNCINALVSIR